MAIHISLKIHLVYLYSIPVEEIHGAKSQNQRESALRNFRNGKTRFLVATDVASRGLDVPAITHVCF